MAPDLVLVHDAARPFVDPAIVSRVLKALETSPAAIAALPVNDTLKRASGGLITGTMEREGLWRAQTPQGFRYPEILVAHRSLAGASLTDDAAVAEQAGLSVGIVMGSEENLKVTTEDDLRRAEHLLGLGDFRTGFGFDVHRFCAGDHVMLCGVAVPCDAGLAGHSDADVGLHALTDAVLGAIGAGDIGSHFPPDDDRWRGAASEIFLSRAGDLVAARGGRIVNLDVTVICERPKIGPHRSAMVRRIADILGLAPEMVNVKATTTERLGFTGRNEGIAAQAVASIRLPGTA
jgi:2-C-methyl-D-erythritol 4-phosphate cytidylyltransferase/2-C-methyl-D-erythritol 2,4-cyclodiphosphate synthase